MNKSYLFLISLLVIIALAVGTFAFYRSTSKPASKIPTVPAATASPSALPENPLPLTVISPQDTSVVSSPTLSLRGQTAPGADVAVNDLDLKADANGNFSTTLTLDEGENYILIVASSENGAAEWQATVTYTPTP